MNTIFFKLGAAIGAISVAIGAFGAHLLKPMLLASSKLDTFETAVKYQFYGAFALLIVGLIPAEYKNKLNHLSGFLFAIGTLVFSGSLYLICFTGINLFGAVAPIGGLCLIAGWCLLFFSIK